MKQHRYRITVEHLADANGQASAYGTPLQFETGSHDDLFAIVERARLRGDFDEVDTVAFAVGLKLFSEVMLKNRKNPVFEKLSPAMAEFMARLKTAQTN